MTNINTSLHSLLELFKQKFNYFVLSQYECIYQMGNFLFITMCQYMIRTIITSLYIRLYNNAIN